MMPGWICKPLPRSSGSSPHRLCTAFFKDGNTVCFLIYSTHVQCLRQTLTPHCLLLSPPSSAEPPQLDHTPLSVSVCPEFSQGSMHEHVWSYLPQHEQLTSGHTCEQNAPHPLTSSGSSSHSSPHWCQVVTEFVTTPPCVPCVNGQERL